MSINTNSVTAYDVTTYFELSWSEQIELATNKSILTAAVTTHQNPAGSGYQRTINANGSVVTINGTTYSISGQKTYDGKVIWNITGIEIEHNQDGTKTITASLKVNVGGDYVSGNGTIELTTILRNSAVEVSPALLTSGNETVTIKPYVDTYTHTVTYKVNDTTVTLATKTTEKELLIAYDDLKAIVGDYRSADVVVTVTTFNGDDELGTNTASFLVQTGKIPFSLYDDKNGNVGVTIGEQATGPGFNVLLDDINLAGLSVIPNANAVKCGYQIDGFDVYRKLIRFTDLVGTNMISKPHGITQYQRIWIDFSESYMYAANVRLSYPFPIIGYDGTFSDKVYVLIYGENIQIQANSYWDARWEKNIMIKYY